LNILGTQHTNFTVVNFKSNQEIPRKDVYTFASANLLLGIEIIGKFQNMGLVYRYPFPLYYLSGPNKVLFYYRRAPKIALALVSRVEDQPLLNYQILDDKKIRQQVAYF